MQNQNLGAFGAAYVWESCWQGGGSTPAPLPPLQCVPVRPVQVLTTLYARLVPSGRLRRRTLHADHGDAQAKRTMNLKPPTGYLLRPHPIRTKAVWDMLNESRDMAEVSEAELVSLRRTVADQMTRIAELQQQVVALQNQALPDPAPAVSLVLPARDVDEILNNTPRREFVLATADEEEPVCVAHCALCDLRHGRALPV